MNPAFPHPFLYDIWHIALWMSGISLIFIAVLSLLRRSDSTTQKKDGIRLGILLGVALIIVTGGAFGPYGLLPLAMIIACVSWMELLRCIQTRYGSIPLFYLYPALGALGIAGSAMGHAFITLGLAVWIAFALPMILTGRPASMPVLFGAAFGVVFISVPLVHLVMLVQMDYGAFAFLIVLVNVHDGFAVGFGRLLGRTPLCPDISPKKTWEGAFGALVICVITGYAVRFLVPGWSLWQVIAGGVLIAVFSVLGDLIASSIKREANVKDFGRALGPTGGFLDRFDSLVFAAPVFYVFALLLGGG